MNFTLRFFTLLIITFALAYGFAVSTGMLSLLFVDETLTTTSDIALYSLVGLSGVCVPFTIGATLFLSLITHSWPPSYSFFHAALTVSASMAAGFGALFFSDENAAALLIGGAAWGVALIVGATVLFVVACGLFGWWERTRQDDSKDLEAPPQRYCTIEQPNGDISLGMITS